MTTFIFSPLSAYLKVKKVKKYVPQLSRVRVASRKAAVTREIRRGNTAAHGLSGWMYKGVCTNFFKRVFETEKIFEPNPLVWMENSSTYLLYSG